MSAGEDYRVDETTLVPGALFGWRQVLINRETGLVTSPCFSALWHEGWMTAQCLRSHLPDSHGAAPNFACKCGFYACYKYDELHSASGIIWSPYMFHVLREVAYIAIVEAKGRIVLGTKGFRAEKVRIVGLAPWLSSGFMGRRGRWWDDLVHNSVSGLQKIFPTQELSALGVRPEPVR